MELLIISFFQRAMINAVPLLFASTGEIVTERSGILNLGVEGMMALGAFIAFAVRFSTGSLLVGILAAMGSSGLLALVHGVATIGFKANQTVSGLAITMVGVGLAGFWGKSFVGLKLPFPDRVPTLGFLTPIPFIGPVLGSLDLFFWGSLVLALWGKTPEQRKPKGFLWKPYVTAPWYLGEWLRDWRERIFPYPWEVHGLKIPPADGDGWR